MPRRGPRAGHVRSYPPASSHLVKTNHPMQTTTDHFTSPAAATRSRGVFALAASVVACIAAFGCASKQQTVNPDASSESPAKAPPLEARSIETPATPGTAPDRRARAESQPAPKRRPAPAVKPIETFEAVWTTVRDRHFDPKLNGVDWNAVRAEFLPRVRAAASQDELRALLSEMLGRLGQSHFGIIPAEAADASPTVTTQDEIADRGGANAESTDPAAPDAAKTDETATDREGSSPTSTSPAAGGGGPGIAGIDIALVEGVPLVTRVTPGLAAARAGVLVGWEVVAIDGERLADALDPIRSALEEEKDANSPHARQLRMVLASTAAHQLAGEAGTSRRVLFRDASGAEQPVTVTFESAPLGTSQFGNLPPFPVEVESRVMEFPTEGGKPVKVGYLSFNIWMTGALAAIERGIDEMRACDGVVIDLRGNVGGVGAMSFGLAGHFLAQPASLGTMAGRDSTLVFNVTPRKLSAAGKRVRPIAKPLAIVVDGRSASTSEIFAAGLQELGRARVFGEPTAGMALPSHAVELPNGDVLLHAISDFTTPKGTRIEGLGVKPDVAVALTRDGLLKGRDAVLDAAARWIEAETLAARARPTAEAPSRTDPTHPTPRERAAARAAAGMAPASQN